tara:strand:- start:522 stop:1259 length:738 start_codon:yes stop_codon:yes gene_type:complete
MKFRLTFLLLFIISCSPNYTKLENRKPYNSTGFAYIYNEEDYIKKIVNRKINNDILRISHQNLKTGTLIKLINPKTKETLVLKNIRNIKYPNFYKILITKSVANKLNINSEFPLIEILEIKKNKSFIAEKAIIFNEEKKISSKAPVTSVQIANISKKEEKVKETIPDNIYILIASFYTKNSAIFLKKRIIKEVPYYNNKILKIRKKSHKEIEVISGPYKSINLLKNDYIELKNFGFEELEIIINE